MLSGDIIPLAPAHSWAQPFNNTLQDEENSAHGFLLSSAGSVSGLCFGKTEAKPFVLSSSRQQLWSPLFWSCAGCVNTGTKWAVLPNSKLIFGSRYGWDSLIHYRHPAPGTRQHLWVSALGTPWKPAPLPQPPLVCLFIYLDKHQWFAVGIWGTILLQDLLASHLSFSANVELPETN